jgi:hypothetical protein
MDSSHVNLAASSSASASSHAHQHSNKSSPSTLWERAPVNRGLRGSQSTLQKRVPHQQRHPRASSSTISHPGPAVPIKGPPPPSLTLVLPLHSSTSLSAYHSTSPSSCRSTSPSTLSIKRHQTLIVIQVISSSKSLSIKLSPHPKSLQPSLIAIQASSSHKPLSAKFSQSKLLNQNLLIKFHQTLIILQVSQPNSLSIQTLSSTLIIIQPLIIQI